MNTRILTSAFVILATVVALSAATYAYFHDQASVTGNTYATGVLEIRVNGQPSITGFNYTNAAPGDVATKSFTLQNYGLPWFAGPSTLAAKDIFAKVANATGDGALFNALNARLYVNAGWGGCSNPGVAFVAGKGCTAYNGTLAGLTNADLNLATQWGAHPDLVPGNSWSILFEVELPNTGGDQSALMGKSTTFDLQFDAYNPIQH